MSRILLKFGLAIAVLGVLFFAISSSETSVIGATVAFTPDEEGAKLFTEIHKCDGCHAVSAAGIEARVKIEKMKGPDLSDFEPPVDFKAFAAYMRGEGEIEGATHRLKYKGSEEDLKKMLDWLDAMK